MPNPGRLPGRGSLEHLEGLLDITLMGMMLVGWTVAFMLGKELQSGFAQWRDRQR